MKIRSAEFLALVAIVTSATVMQVREHMQDTTSPRATPTAVCGPMRDGNGLLPAACEATRDTNHTNHIEQPADRPAQLRPSPRIWV